LTRYLLDTNVISHLMRHRDGDVTERIREVGEPRICTSAIVAAELRYGAAKKGSARLSAQLDAVLGALEVLPFEAPAAVTYGSLRAHLDKAGRSLGGNDLLIAAQALSLGFILVTDNEREFGRIDDLSMENWLHSGR
jgi:tRNA(fMet)-specific endonuclease VapC